jgi:hypothetical protein
LTPTVVGVGKVHPLPQAAYQPQPRDTYNVVFSITKAAIAATEINSSLERVARTVNLYTSAGVPLSHLGFVAVISGQATDAALDDGHYRQKYGVGNPNLGLIRTLRNAGVDVVVSGQALEDRQEQSLWIAPEVTLALSGLTTITHDHAGYRVEAQSAGTDLLARPIRRPVLDGPGCLRGSFATRSILFARSKHEPVGCGAKKRPRPAFGALRRPAGSRLYADHAP